LLRGTWWVAPATQPAVRPRPVRAICRHDSNRRSQSLIDEKAPVYAAAGIPDAWIADLPVRRFLIHREPAGRAYRGVTVVERGTLSPLTFSDVEVRVEEILGG
jgi:hypothetical protein